MEPKNSRTSNADHRRALLNDLGTALPRSLWPSLSELLRLEYGTGVRDAVARLQQTRKKREECLNSFALRFSPAFRDLDLESLEEVLLSTGRVPKGRPGRPRKDQEADEIIRLKLEGKSWATIARKLKKTPDACRQLVKRRLSEMEAENRRLEAENRRLEAQIEHLGTTDVARRD